jgi:hypothetical protein
MWRKSLRDGNVIHPNGRVKVALGKRVVNNEESESQWTHYYDSISGCLYETVSAGYKVYQQNAKARRYQQFRHPHSFITTELPVSATPVDYSIQGHNYHYRASRMAECATTTTSYHIPATHYQTRKVDPTTVI